jgi:hypothetical protein
MTGGIANNIILVDNKCARQHSNEVQFSSDIGMRAIRFDSFEFQPSKRHADPDVELWT